MATLSKILIILYPTPDCLRFGVDYSDSDIAHESDDGESVCRNRIGVWGNGEAAAASAAGASKSSNEVS